MSQESLESLRTFETRGGGYALYLGDPVRPTHRQRGVVPCVAIACQEMAQQPGTSPEMGRPVQIVDDDTEPAHTGGLAQEACRGIRPEVVEQE